MKKFSLATSQAYYFDPLWSPDSKRIAFRDNRLQHLCARPGRWRKVQRGGRSRTLWGGVLDQTFAMAWSPDSKWLAWTRSLKNHMHGIVLFLGRHQGRDAGDGRDGRCALSRVRPQREVSLLPREQQCRGPDAWPRHDEQSLPADTLDLCAGSDAGHGVPIEPESDDEKSLARHRQDAKENADATPAADAASGKTDATGQAGRGIEDACGEAGGDRSGTARTWR